MYHLQHEMAKGNKDVGVAWQHAEGCHLWIQDMMVDNMIRVIDAPSSKRVYAMVKLWQIHEKETK